MPPRKEKKMPERHKLKKDAENKFSMTMLLQPQKKHSVIPNPDSESAN